MPVRRRAVSSFDDKPVETALLLRLIRHTSACWTCWAARGTDRGVFDVPDQANQRILDNAAQRLGVSPEKVVSNLAEYGNTSAASIPLALDEAVRANTISQGPCGGCNFLSKSNGPMCPLGEANDELCALDDGDVAVPWQARGGIQGCAILRA